MNQINRFDITPQTTERNIENAGRPIDEVIITDNGSEDGKIKEWAVNYADLYCWNDENIGNPQALNKMLSICSGDVIVIAGNDIALPVGWLDEAIKAIERLPKCGLIGFHCVGGLPKETELIHDLRIKRPANVFGTWVMSRELFKDVGYFWEFSKYGCWDADYNIRVRHAGYNSIYLSDFPSIHKGNDSGSKSQYRQLKDSEMKKGCEKLIPMREEYNENKYHVTKDQKLIMS